MCSDIVRIILNEFFFEINTIMSKDPNDYLSGFLWNLNPNVFFIHHVYTTIF